MSTMSLSYNNKKTNTQKAQRFTMWLGIVSMAMSFGGWTSAFLVRKAAGSWVNFTMPSIFYASTLVILLSSVTMHIAHIANKNGKSGLMKLNLFMTFCLGVLFFLLQRQGWYELEQLGIYVDGNVSGSFFFVITWGHAAHILLATFLVLIAFVRSYFLFKQKGVSHFHEGDLDFYKIRTDLLIMFWHFLDFLWVYIFIFLKLNH